MDIFSFGHANELAREQIICTEGFNFEGDFELPYLINRDPTKEFDESYKDLCRKIKKSKKEDTHHNYFASILRAFKVPGTAKLGFISNELLRQNYSFLIGACYIFKFMYPTEKGHDFGLYIRLNNACGGRRAFDRFAVSTANLFVGGESCRLYSIQTTLKSNVPLFDSLRTLYVDDRNLLVNFSHRMDAIPRIQPSHVLSSNDYVTLTKLADKMRVETQ